METNRAQPRFPLQVHRVLTETSDGSSDVAHDGSFGIAHLPLDGQLRLHVEPAQYHAYQNQQDPRASKYWRNYCDGGKFQQHIHGHFREGIDAVRD